MKQYDVHYTVTFSGYVSGVCAESEQVANAITLELLTDKPDAMMLELTRAITAQQNSGDRDIEISLTDTIEV